MKTLLFIILFFLTISGFCSSPVSDCIIEHESVYQYIFEKNNTDIFTIIFDCRNENLSATIIGPSEYSNQGMFYFISKVNNLKISNLDNITFDFVKGNLYKDLITEYNYKEVYTWEYSAISNSKLFMKAQLFSDRMELTCKSDDNSCYESKMIFYLNK
jgi:hypothetical protein